MAWGAVTSPRTRARRDTITRGMVHDLPEGTVTVLFTDVQGSTTLAATRGDQTARELMRECEQLTREQLELHNGREVKGTGDGVMAAFASARRAVTCAIEIQRHIERRNLARPDEVIRLRIGLNSGEVIRERDDLFGSTVNAAARIEAACEVGQILVSEAVRLLLGPGSDIELIDRGEFALRGFAEPWRLFEVVWREPEGAPAAQRRSPFVGRDQEHRQLRTLLEGADHGQGSLALVAGEPGVGKTRLTRELAAEADARGFVALTGRCYDIEGATPYSPFVEVLETIVRSEETDVVADLIGTDGPQIARLVPRLRTSFPEMLPAPELPPEQDRRYLHDGVRAFLERLAERRTLLLVVDDMHWADEPSLQLLHYLTQRVRDTRMVVIGTYRHTDLGPERPLERLLPTLVREAGPNDIRLNRLSPDSVNAMLRAYGSAEPPGRVSRLIFSETEGNPLFVEQVVRHLTEGGRIFDEHGRWRADVEVGEDEVPHGVRLVIGERLKRVSRSCRNVLRSAAVIGRAFSFELLHELAGEDEETLLAAMDEAEASLLISPESTGPSSQLRFAHEVIRQTLLGDLSQPRRQRLHLRVAEALERTHGTDADRHASEIAIHLQLAGPVADDVRSVRYLTVAAQQALEIAAFEDAMRLAESALQRLTPDESPGQAELLFFRGLAHRGLGDWAAAEADWEAALDAAEAGGMSELVGRITAEYARQLGYVRRVADSLAVAERGLAAVDESASGIRARLLAFSTFSSNSVGLKDFGSVSEAATEAIRLAEAAQDQEALGAVLEQNAHLLWQNMQMEEAAATFEHALETRRAVDNRYAQANPRAWRALTLVALGRFREVDAVTEDLTAFCEEVGDSGALFATRRALAFMDFPRTGDLARWQAFAAADLELLSELGSGWTGNAHSYIALGMFWRGDWETALEHAEQAAALELEDAWAGADHAALLLLRAYRGESEAVRRLLRRVSRSLPLPGVVNRSGTWELLPAAIEALAVIGDRHAAAELYDAAADAANGPAVIRYWTKTLPHTSAGIAAACGERWESADAHFLSALRQAEEIPNRVDQAEARRWFAWMLLSRDQPGDRERARELVAEARHRYGEMGMEKHRELASRYGV